MYKTYSTSQIAKMVGVHSNTVRKYEEWGLIQIPQRKENGYHVYNKKLWKSKGSRYLKF
ncbi:MAG: MerR family DNA-binding transcriptional regulator [Cellulosilyticum sp.]|nr:MerR family DNA-binding transcriptional regulator [Cellulosilyticum sp.]